MPVDLQLSGEQWDTTVTVFNDSARQTFLFMVPRPVKSIELDPEGWILKNIREDFSKQFVLRQNYPNPFQSATHIEYRLPERMNVKLSVYDILGREVAKLVDDVQPMGEYSVKWNGVTDKNTAAASGIYFYRIQGSTKAVVKKMIMMR